MSTAQQVAAPPLVIKVGGALLDQASAQAEFWSKLCELHGDHPGGVVLVHGGGAAVDRHLERLGLRTERREGIRITPPEQIGEIVAVLAGSVNKTLVGAIQAQGVAAVGLCLSDGCTAHTVQADQYGFDPGRVGRVDGGDSTLLRGLLRDGFLPVLCSIGLDANGEPLNVNADDAATAIAVLVAACGLVLLTDVPGVLDGNGELISELANTEPEERIRSGEIHGGMIPKVRGASRAAAEIGAPVTIASWKTPAQLPCLARGENVGTRVLPPPRSTSAQSVSHET